MRYTGISIGPIVRTLSMVRKPRDLWSASYMFSLLMKYIYGELQESKDVTIISPEVSVKIPDDVGIYPDRVYFKGEVEVKSILKKAKDEFLRDIGMQETVFDNYFNLMVAFYDDASSESDAIAQLNQRLDVMELCNFAADVDATEKIHNIIAPHNKKDSIYHKMTAQDKEVDSLAEIATAHLRALDPEAWKQARTAARIEERVIENIKRELGYIPDDLLIKWEDFYTKLGKINTGTLKNHHKYFCVVQADGDNMGAAISHKDLQDGAVAEISKALVKFGLNATETIKAYGGFPVYAGGDDLLFIAPVIGKDGTHIFDLLNKIENDAFKEVSNEVAALEDKDGKKLGIEVSLSFGVSISYYKYPLYEALEKARELLFDVAKDKNKFPSKKVVAWSLRKHSGGTFDVAFSLKIQDLMTQFVNLIAATVDGNTVSAVAHKIRQEEALVDIVLESKDADRLDTLFEKVLGFDTNKSSYFNAVKDIMPTLYDVIGEENYVRTLYSLLRTAKFINGEDLRDE